MRTILDEIVANRRKEVAEQKEKIGFARLEQMLDLSLPTNSLSDSLRERDASGIIAEFKRKSPSKGIINDSALPSKVVKEYVDAGASGVSVLTDTKYFGGTNEDLRDARGSSPLTPLLRKDFIVDRYQVMEARVIGADVILLIASVLDGREVVDLTTFAHEVGLEVLLEVHDEREMDKIDSSVNMVGVNNRSLKDFTVDVERSARLAEMLPSDVLRISESGIDTVEMVMQLQGEGFKGFLMGENFMRGLSPGEECRGFIERLKALQQ